MRKRVQYKVSNPEDFQKKLLIWAQQFEEVVWLDSNDHHDRFGSFDALLAVDAATSIELGVKAAFEGLRKYHKSTQDWFFGYLSYDLKNDLESLSSENKDQLHFPELRFFQPKRIIKINDNNIEFIYMNEFKGEIQSDYHAILYNSEEQDEKIGPPLKIRMQIFKDEYFRRVQKLLEHIHRGDIYELNFCQEFYAENAVIDPLEVYNRLNSISKAPFSALVKFGHTYALSASPERFLRKNGRHVISQPMKGTAKRSGDPVMDQTLKEQLASDIKERAENIMIADLVRNDMSKSAMKGSVMVDELCEVYTYKQVHQMVSTIISQVPSSVHPVDIIRDCFPMGSMTGAPKISAMKLIEQYETTKRGVYSGAIGYFSPKGDFDFNVVIRSILYNKKKKYLSFSVGSAITAKASPEKEYQECLLKAKAMRSVLESTESSRLTTA